MSKPSPPSTKKSGNAAAAQDVASLREDSRGLFKIPDAPKSNDERKYRAPGSRSSSGPPSTNKDNPTSSPAGSIEQNGESSPPPIPAKSPLRLLRSHAPQPVPSANPPPSPSTHHDPRDITAGHGHVPQSHVVLRRFPTGNIIFSPSIPAIDYSIRGSSDVHAYHSASPSLTGSEPSVFLRDDPSGVDYNPRTTGLASTFSDSSSSEDDEKKDNAGSQGS